MRNTFNRTVSAAAAALLLLSSASVNAQSPVTSRCESAAIFAQYVAFSDTGRMSPELIRFLNDPVLQKMEPYKAFDNVYYVGVCWVSAWLITSPRGHVLIDSLYGGYTDTLIENIRTLGFDLKDIKLVAMTHGHRDHAGGAAKLKQALQPGTRFAMSAEGWREAAETAAQSTGTPIAWTMIERDLVLADGQTVSAGNITLQSFDTPGHTMGTVSFAFDARDGSRTWRAFTIGGAGPECRQGARAGRGLHRQRQAHPRANRRQDPPDRIPPTHASLHHRPHRSQGTAQVAQAWRAPPTRRSARLSPAARRAAERR